MSKKDITLSIQIQVDAALTEEQIAENVQKALAKEGIASFKSSGGAIGKLKVTTAPKSEKGASAAGYDSRLWEKVTC